MAILETAIRNALLANDDLTDLVSTRVRPLIMGQANVLPVGASDGRPFVTYKVTNRETDACLDGSITDYRRAEWELGIYADTYDEVIEISEVCRDTLDQNGDTVSSIEFAPAAFVDETDIEEVLPEGQEKPVYLRVQTYRALYRSTD